MNNRVDVGSNYAMDFTDTMSLQRYQCGRTEVREVLFHTRPDAVYDLV
jgi:hypothetical protein